jgi:Nuclear protein 96
MCSRFLVFAFLSFIQAHVQKDGLYLLLTLFQQPSDELACSAVEAQAFSNHPLDYCAPVSGLSCLNGQFLSLIWCLLLNHQWLLLHVLTDFCATNVSPAITFDVTVALCGLLESFGEWELAIFVASRLQFDAPNGTDCLIKKPVWTDCYAAEWLVKDVLHRHIIELSASAESQSFLCDSVGVPGPWIADAKGFAAANNDSNFTLAAEHFKDAGNSVEVRKRRLSV